MKRWIAGALLSISMLSGLLGIFAVVWPEGAMAQGSSAARPDLNGIWRVNGAESDSGQVPPPLKQSEEVTQAGDEMAIAVSIERPETKQSYTLRFRVGGG